MPPSFWSPMLRVSVHSNKTFNSLAAKLCLGLDRCRRVGGTPATEGSSAEGRCKIRILRGGGDRGMAEPTDPAFFWPRMPGPVESVDLLNFMTALTGVLRLSKMNIRQHLIDKESD